MPIKVLVISNYKSFHTIRPEAEIFIGLAKQGFEITIMTYGDAQYVPIFKEAGIRVIDFHPRKKLNKEEIQFIRQELIEGKYHIVHLFNNSSIINGIQAARGLSVKVVLYRGYAGNISRLNPIDYLKFLNPRVDKILCNSQGVADYLDARLWHKNKTKMINKGHRVEWYQDIKPADLSEFKLPKDAFIIVNVANNRRMKGIPYLLEAMNRLPQELPIHLLLVGNDMQTPTNLKIIANSPNKNKVHFLGFRPDALNIVAASHVFALSSIKGESITKSVIEAMSLARTPVITDIAGNKELLEPNKSGLVVPSKNAQAFTEAFVKLYKDRALCQKLGIEAQNYIKTKLNSERTIAEYMQFYTELASQ